MIIDALTYIMHIAPSLGVTIILVFAMNKRMGKNEARVQDILENCMNKVLDHLNEHDS